MGKIKVLGAVGAAVGGIVVGVMLWFSFLRKKEPDASKKGSETGVSSSGILSGDESPLSDIKTDEESKNGDSVTYSNPVADESGSGDSSEKREKMSILVQGVTDDSQSSESLQEKMKNLMDARAKERVDDYWKYDEFKGLLDEAMSADETLDDGIENLKTCKEFLKGIFCDENGDCKKNLSSSDLKINCKKAGELLINLEKAKKSLFRAFIEGYRGDRNTSWNVGVEMTGLRRAIDTIIGIVENGEITVEGMSDPDGAIRLQKEINDLLNWLNENVVRVLYHMTVREFGCTFEEEAYYKVFDDFLEEYFRERESRKKS